MLDGREEGLQTGKALKGFRTDVAGEDYARARGPYWRIHVGCNHFCNFSIQIKMGGLEEHSQIGVERMVYDGELYGFSEARTKYHKATSLAT